jgi:hypothetical protein
MELEGRSGMESLDWNNWIGIQRIWIRLSEVIVDIRKKDVIIKGEGMERAIFKT